MSTYKSGLMAACFAKIFRYMRILKNYLVFRRGLQMLGYRRLSISYGRCNQLPMPDPVSKTIPKYLSIMETLIKLEG